ncbi:PAS domain S-box protein [Fodinibius halophilus]|uniref:PAS domain S-box protein n=1 Tax=Fodinibius halophilus TaxID=1736908 RepID=A0A6M1T238_9BACT|nr:PAS domain S-box protein [Fodinibius halophilus]NGP87285.1 PAS domain S-box protein [Fodinibius halophilus]
MNELERGALWGSWELNIATDTFRCSSKAAHILGLSSGRGLDKEELSAHIPSGERNKFETVIDNAAKKGTLDTELRIEEKDSSFRYIKLQAELVGADANQQKRLVGTVHELLSPEAEVKLDKSLSNSMIDGYLLISMNKNEILDVNPAYCQMVGYTADELIGKKINNLDLVVNQEDFKRRTKKIIKQGGGRFRTRHQHKSGKAIHLEVSITILEKRGTTFVMAFMTDITDRITTKQKLEESEERWHRLVENVPQGIVISVDGRLQYLNQAASNLVEVADREKLLGEQMVNFADGKYKERLRSRQEKIKEVEKLPPADFEIPVEGDDKKVIRTYPVTIKYKGQDAILAVLNDITTLKKKQEELRQGEKKWRHLVKKNPQPVQIVQAGKIVFINQAGASLYGAESPDELIERSAFDFTHPNNIDLVKERRRKFEEGLPVENEQEQKIIDLDGNEKHVLIHSIATIYQDKPAIQTVLFDLTEREREQQRIRSSLKEKETMLKEIHHRIKNNLSVISGLLELQAMNTEEEATLNTLRDSQQRIHSMAMIHEKLYQSEALADIGFDTYLKELVESISQTYNTSNRNIDISYDLESTSLDLDHAIPCSLIVNEIIVNCYKHAFDGKKNGKIMVSSEVKGSELVIRIKDNGDGLPEDFALEQQQSLGMTLIQTLTQQLDGTLNFYSNNDQGTTVELCFEK